jgi:uncharacterized DUF497 family protein
MAEDGSPYARLSVFEWDDNKRRLNVLKHGIDFDDAKEVFYDPAALTFVSPSQGEEKRYVTIGLMGGVLITVISTPRDVAIRIISARAARHSERKLHGTHKKKETRR